MKKNYIINYILNQNITNFSFFLKTMNFCQILKHENEVGFKRLGTNFFNTLR